MNKDLFYQLKVKEEWKGTSYNCTKQMSHYKLTVFLAEKNGCRYRLVFAVVAHLQMSFSVGKLCKLVELVMLPYCIIAV